MLLCCHRCIADDATPPQEIKTEHYDLYVEGTDGKEVGKLVEGLYGELRQFFYAEPDCRLRVKVLPNRQRLEEVLDADEVVVRTHSEEGLYWPKTKTAYLYTDPADQYFTRLTILHECTHQFHYLSRTGNRNPGSRYYAEGLAEHFGVHRWDGRSAQVAGIPDVEARDVPGHALRSFKDQHHGSFRALATDADTSDKLDYCEAWGLVSFLISEEPEAYRKWSMALDHGAMPEDAWLTAFAVDHSDEQLSQKYLRWLQAHQEPWEAKNGVWQNTAAHRLEAEGSTSSHWSAAISRLPIGILKFSAEATSQKARLGVVAVQYVEGKNMMESTIMTVNAGGSVYVASSHDADHPGDWTLVDHIKVRDPRKFGVEIRRQDSGFDVFIDGTAAVKLEGNRIGPGVYNGPATFSNIETGMLSSSKKPPTAIAPTSLVRKTSYALFVWPASAGILAASLGLAWWARKRRRERGSKPISPMVVF